MPSTTMALEAMDEKWGKMKVEMEELRTAMNQQEQELIALRTEFRVLLQAHGRPLPADVPTTGKSLRGSSTGREPLNNGEIPPQWERSTTQELPTRCAESREKREMLSPRCERANRDTPTPHTETKHPAHEQYSRGMKYSPPHERRTRDEPRRQRSRDGWNYRADENRQMRTTDSRRLPHTERSYNPRTAAERKGRNRRRDQRPGRKRSPWNHQPRNSGVREIFRGQTPPRTRTQGTRDKRKTVEPPDSPRPGQGRQEGIDLGGKTWGPQPPGPHGQTDHHHSPHGPEGRKSVKSSITQRNRPGNCGRTQGETENVPRWETKRRRSTPATTDLERFIPGKKSYPPQEKVIGNEAEEPEQLQNSSLRERTPLKMETAVEPGDQWFLDDYSTALGLNGAFPVPTETAHKIGPRSEASSNVFSENTLRADAANGGGYQGGLPLEEEGDGETWGLPALDLWLGDEDKPIFPHLEDKVGLSRAG